MEASMLHKRKFGKKGYVAVLAPAPSCNDVELMGRADAAGLQFGITHDYAYTFFKSTRDPKRSYGYLELIELATRIVNDEYITVITIGPEAFSAFNEVAARMEIKRMVIGIDCPDALENNQPQQFEMLNMHPEFNPNLSNLVRTCLEKNISQEDGIAEIQKYEQARAKRSWGIFDDCYVLLKNRAGKKQLVRFEDKEDVILPPAPEHPFLGRGRIILFKA